MNLPMHPLSAAIRGSGGGKGGGASKPPVEAPDSLRSIAYARILDLVSEGEIYGFADQANPLTCVFFNETVVQNADGTKNFVNFQIDSRTGTQTQDPIEGFGGVESESGVGVRLEYGQPWTRTFTNTNVTSMRVRLSVPSLSKTDTTNGNTNGTTVNYTIELATDGGAFVNKLTADFTGKASNKYERSHLLQLPPATTGWTVRVTRNTAESQSQALSNQTYVEAVTEIIDAKLRLPMSAYIGLIIDAEQFNNIPQRAYRLRGRLIRIPSNYNPTTRAYTGIWDGTFGTAYSNNPAWVFYDMATHPRYGLGHLVSSDLIDKWALYKIATYCDELVPDGFGGMEPRFTANVYLQNQQDALKVMQDLASMFRGIMYAAGGAITAVGDMPEDPVYPYNPGNVVNGKFTYSGSSRKVRHTVALVSWNDMTDFGRAKVEYIDDPDGIARYGIQPTEVIAIGCTSRGQARRMGKYILTTERYETDMLAFSVGLDGTIPAPGKIVLVADPLRAGRRTGGRLRTATLTTITVDQLPIVEIGNEITVALPNGGVNKRTISGIAGNQITVSAAFDFVPVPQSVWLIESATLKAQRFRVLGVTENANGIDHDIVAIQHVEGKFDFVENNLLIEEAPISDVMSRVMASPSNVMMTHRDVADTNSTQKIVTLTWSPILDAKSYNVMYRLSSGSWTNVGDTAAPSIDILSLPPGIFEVQVTAISGTGVRSNPTFAGPFDIDPNIKPPGFLLQVNADITAAMNAAGTAQEAADLAQAVADGAIQSHFQIAAPTGLGASDVGDIWFDTDDNNKIYRWSGTAWVATPDSRIAQAILDAADAQATADGKVKTFAQNEPPTATGVGDLWVDTNDGNKLYRWNNSAWVVIQDTGIGAALTAAQNAQAAADGSIASFWQPGAPVIGAGEGQAKVGDIWFDTDAGNKIYRVVGGVWTLAADDAIAQAILDASNAQATADGKVTLFVGAVAPTSGMQLNDMWFDTTRNSTYRYNGSNWLTPIADVTLDQIGGTGVNLLPDHLSVFPADVALPGATNGTVSRDAAFHFALGALVLTANAADAYVHLGPSNSILVQPSKAYLVSFWVACNQVSKPGQVYLRGFGGAYAPAASFTTPATANAAGRVCVRIDMAGNLDSAIQLRLDNDGGAGCVMTFDGIMVEQAVGRAVVPSAYSRGTQHFTIEKNLADALTAASAAQDTADGKVDFFFQNDPPAGSEGDYWIDTNDNNKLYRHNGTVFVIAADQRIAQAITDAAGAQGTADGKVRSWFGTVAPTTPDVTASKGIGDLWINTGDKNKLHRWSGTAWVLYRDIGITDAQAAADAAASAASAAQTAANTANNALAIITSDAWLSKGEKPAVMRQHQILSTEVPGIQARADAYAQGRVQHDTALNDLNVYLGSLSPAWNNLTADTPIVSATFNSKFSDYFLKRQELLDAISVKAKTLADSAIDSLTGGGNRFPDPEFSDTSELNYGGSAGGTVLINEFASRTVPGQNGLHIRLTSGVANNYSEAYVGRVTPIPVAVGQHYIFSCYCGSIGNTAITIYVRAYDSAGVFVGTMPTINGVVKGGDTFINGYDRVFNKYTIPATAVRLEIWMRVTATGDVSSGTNAGFFLMPMLEQVNAAQVLPSPYSAGAAVLSARVTSAIAAAATAQAAADGAIVLYKQSTAPASGMSEGDIWIDTDDNKMYVREGAAWVLRQDSQIGAAINAAATAQSTADGKITTFYTASTPTATGLGDLWFNTSTSVLLRWSGSAWVMTNDGGVAALGDEAVINGDFEASAELPPVGWAASGPVGLTWSTSGHYAGARSLIVSGAQAGIAAVSKKKFGVVPGQRWRLTAFSRRTFGDGQGRLQAYYYSNTGAYISSQGFSGITSFVWAEYEAQLTVPANASYFLISLNIVGQTTSSNVHFDQVRLSKVRDLDTEIDDGVVFGRYSVDDRFAYNNKWRVGLRVPGSSHRIGDQRNLPQSNTTAYGSVRTTTALSATSAGAITVNAHTVRYGGVSIAYSAVANAITGKAVGTSWVVYCYDDGYTGGVKTWYAGTSPEAVMALGDGVVVAGQITIPASGSSGGGGGGAGGDPNDWCVVDTMLLPDGMMARDVEAADKILCWDYDAAYPKGIKATVEYNKLVEAQPCVRIVTTSGAAVAASLSTPMTLRNGDSVTIGNMLGLDALVRDKWGNMEWEQVVAVEPLGLRTVAKITVHQLCYFAGENAERTIATHNAIMKP